MYAASRQWWVAGLFGVLGMAGQVQAASSVLIWPIDPVLEADQQASALWLENRGTAPANLQVRVFAWRQGDYQEQFQAQRSALPGLMKLLPDAERRGGGVTVLVGGRSRQHHQVGRQQTL